MTPRPFTPATLAERWECSESTVRALIKSGRLRAFKLAGKLYRITQAEVERFECQNTDLSGTVESGASPTQMASEAAFVSPPARYLAAWNARTRAVLGLPAVADLSEWPADMAAIARSV